MHSMLPRFLHRLVIALPLVLAGALASVPAVSQAPSAETRAPNPSGLQIPRWVSIRAGEVNMRTGPGARYPIDWVLQFRNLPVEVVGEFENWRQVRAQDDTTGWVHKSMLSGNRMASVAVARARVMQKPDSGAPVAAFVEEGVVVALDACEPDWCRVAIASHGVEGWIPRAALWGLYPGEAITP
jgi:SH3-like domain-containing protein